MLCAVTLTATAQKEVDAIRKRYGEMKQMISLMGEGPDWQDRAIDADSPGGWPPEYFQVKVVQNLPATGYHEENVKMFFEEVRTSEEEIYPPLRLAFASSKYNFAAREFYEEYLYDEQGKLIFITIVKTRRHDEEQFQEEYSGEMVPDEYTEWLDQYIISSQNIQKMFDAVNAGKHL